MIDRLRELLRADGVTAWDVWAEASWEAEPDGMWSLAPFVRWAERELIIACSPDTIRELLDAHDRMAGALRDAYEAMDAASKWASHQGPERDRHGDVTPEAADRHSAGFDALLDAQVRAGQALGILSGGAALAVPKEENPE